MQISAMRFGSMRRYPGQRDETCDVRPKPRWIHKKGPVTALSRLRAEQKLPPPTGLAMDLKRIVISSSTGTDERSCNPREHHDNRHASGHL